MHYIGKINRQIKVVWDNLLDYVFPKQCFVCKKEGEYLCSACFDDIELNAVEKCIFCHKANCKKGICSDCSQKYYIERIFFISHYKKNVMGQLVEALKYKYLESLGETLSKLFVRQVIENNLEHLFYNQSFQPIPLHKKRFKERGFNQSQLLAEFLSDQFNGRLINYIYRAKYTEQQAKMNREERLKNLNQAFVCHSNLQVSKQVILVDDVITTGSTFVNAAKVLHEAGVEKIICLAICHD